MSRSTPLLRVDALSLRFDDVQALSSVTLELEEGEFLCVVGPTNAGKTTLLKTIAGLHRPDSGSIILAGVDVTRDEPRDRRVSLLFQNNALFPDRTGFDNIAFALRARGRDGTAILARVHEVAAALGVTHLLDRLPNTWSGGEQQRVAIGRAIADYSDLLLLDEPLSSLDARLRVALRLQFKLLGRDRARGIVYVTHDHVEAMTLGDRIAVLHQGRVQQIGTPDDIYHRPVNRFVAEFFGSPPMNLLDATIVQDADVPTLAGPGFRVESPQLAPTLARNNPPPALQLGVRAEAVRVAGAYTEATPLAARVSRIERLGTKRVLDLELGPQRLRAVIPPDHEVRSEGEAWIGFTPQPHHLVDRASGRFLR